MMIEDLYKTTDKLNAHIENMALNKVNIEFLRKQMDKVLEDIEKLKDQTENLNTQMVTDNDRKSVVALLMFINGEIKEHVFKITWLHAFEANVKLKELFQNLYPTNATRVRQRQRSIEWEKNPSRL